MKYQEGDKVRIVMERTKNMESFGKMDKYLNTIMTINDVFITSYTMEEDGGYWEWKDSDILGLAYKLVSIENLNEF